MAKFPARPARDLSQPAPSYEHIENFTNDLEVTRDLGHEPGQPGQPGSYEETLRRLLLMLPGGKSTPTLLPIFSCDLTSFTPSSRER